MCSPISFKTYPENINLVKSWQDIHGKILSHLDKDISLAKNVDLGIYYYAVYKAFGHEQDLTQAHLSLTKSLTNDAFSSQARWSTESILALAGIAQLAHWLKQDELIFRRTEAFFAPLDKKLMAYAQELLVTQLADHGRVFFQILRYLQLRLSANGNTAALTTLLQQAQATYDNQQWTLVLPPPTKLTQNFTALGLADGLAGEALQLVKLYKAGMQQPVLLEAIQARLVSILTSRRKVDFSENSYGMFPNAIFSTIDEAQSGQELTWRSGDLGQAVLLYEACTLLQDKELAGLAELVGLNTLLRKEARTTAIYTSEFYAGAAGTAQLYRQLYQLSSNTAYEVGYHYWLTQMQQLLAQDLANNLYQQESGLRHNLVITGLVLLSAIAPQTVEWEQRFW